VNRDHQSVRNPPPPAAPDRAWCAWLACDAAQVPSDDDWLTPAERAHLAALHIHRRRAEWRLGRWTAKHAVALADGRGALTLDRIAIIATESGAPLALIDSTPARCAISISHAAGRGLCVVGPSAVALGCDLERVEPRSAAFVADYFTAAERAVVEQAASDQRACLATLIWSAKEAALKALRDGLRLDTREVEVKLASGVRVEGWRPLLITHPPSGQRFDGWWRHEGDLVATVAADTRLDLPQALDARALMGQPAARATP
jgi:4'-phosphopantetheinyl transferase